jgi:hypothetical protein
MAVVAEIWIEFRSWNLAAEFDVSKEHAECISAEDGSSTFLRRVCISYQTTRCHNAGVYNITLHRYENLKHRRRVSTFLNFFIIVQNSQNFSGLFPSSCIPKNTTFLCHTLNAGYLIMSLTENTCTCLGCVFHLFV